MKNSLSVFWTAFCSYLKSYRVDRLWFVIEFIRPFFWIATSIFLFRTVALQNNSEVATGQDYIGFLVFGVAVQSVYFMLMWNTGTAVISEKMQGTLETILVSPVNRLILFSGKIAAMITVQFWQFVYVIAIGVLLFGMQIQTGNIGLIVCGLAVTLIAIFSMGLLMSHLFLVMGRKWETLGNLLQEPIYLLSGIYFPVEVLPSILQPLAYLLPLAPVLDVMRGAFLYGLQLPAMVIGIAWILILSSFYLAITAVISKLVEKYIKRGGELSFA